jgi:hypothetical protein
MLKVYDKSPAPDKSAWCVYPFSVVTDIPTFLKSETNEKITNLTTAASIWFSASIGMAIGFNFYIMTIIAIAFAVYIPRMPHISKLRNVDR